MKKYYFLLLVFVTLSSILIILTIHYHHSYPYAINRSDVNFPENLTILANSKIVGNATYSESKWQYPDDSNGLSTIVTRGQIIPELYLQKMENLLALKDDIPYHEML